jgi:hypothetical protein
MDNIKAVKNTHFILVSIASGLLLGFSYLPWSPIITVFVAVIPLIWLGRRTTLGSMLLATIVASLIAVAIADWEVWLRHGVAGGSFIWLLQALILSLPFLSFHLIHHRHNPKLGIWALIGTWLTIEWASGQFIGWWQGFQLGYAFMGLPILVQWYAILGVTGGTLWALAVNSQLYRLVFPANAGDKRAGIINLVIFILFPLVFSFFSYFNGVKEDAQVLHLLEADAKLEERALSDRLIMTSYDANLGKQYPEQSLLMVEGQEFLAWQYQMAADTILNAQLFEQGRSRPILARSLKTSGIGGVSTVNSHLLNWDKLPLGLLNRSSLMHADLWRLHKVQGVELFLGFAEADAEALTALGRSRLRRLAQARALENRTAVLSIEKEQESMFFLPSGKQIPLNWEEQAALVMLPKSRDSFYSNYGDLVGRVSIFLTFWLLLATIVKPYRKK